MDNMSYVSGSQNIETAKINLSDVPFGQIIINLSYFCIRHIFYAFVYFSSLYIYIFSINGKLNKEFSAI